MWLVIHRICQAASMKCSWNDWCCIWHKACVQDSEFPFCWLMAKCHSSVHSLIKPVLSCDPQELSCDLQSKWYKKVREGNVHPFQHTRGSLQYAGYLEAIAAGLLLKQSWHGKCGLVAHANKPRKPYHHLLLSLNAVISLTHYKWNYNTVADVEFCSGSCPLVGLNILRLTVSLPYLQVGYSMSSQMASWGGSFCSVLSKKSCFLQNHGSHLSFHLFACLLCVWIEKADGSALVCPELTVIHTNGRWQSDVTN